MNVRQRRYELCERRCVSVCKRGGVCLCEIYGVCCVTDTVGECEREAVCVV